MLAVVATGGVIGIAAGAALGRVVGNRAGAVTGTLIGAVVGVAYAYTLNAGLLIPEFVFISPVTIAAALLCGLQGGVFYAFSTAVMPALARQPHPSGMAAMKTMNVVVFNPWRLRVGRRRSPHDRTRHMSTPRRFWRG